ncbi:unnamed protein product [Prunus brigantina]
MIFLLISFLWYEAETGKEISYEMVFYVGVKTPAEDKKEQKPPL